MSYRNESVRQLLGILECPHHQGFFEFVYNPGDRVSELKERVKQVWGLAGDTEAGDIPWNMVAPGSYATGLWVILCEDEEGAYLTLSDKAQIPTAPPRARGTARDMRPTNHSFRVISEDISEDPPTRLKMKVTRHYSIPKGQKYSVKLLALIQVVGA